jgi:hypothetical protein
LNRGSCQEVFIGILLTQGNTNLFFCPFFFHSSFIINKALVQSIITFYSFPFLPFPYSVKGLSSLG